MQKTKARPYDREDLSVKDNKKDKYKRKVYKNPFDARKAADDEDRQNLKEIRAVQDKIKPVKAVLGVAVLATKKGRDTLKKFLKGKKEVAAASPGMAAIPTTMNKGGGMDMGHKPRPRGNPGIVETVVGKGGDYIKDLID